MLFKEVIGQNHLKEKLIDAVLAGRIAHSQLFLGNLGYGGLPLALAYAQFVNCEASDERKKEIMDSCGTCSMCKRMMHLVHPDLHFSYPLPGSKNISLDMLDVWRSAITQNPYLDIQEWFGLLESDNKQGNISALECRNILKRLSYMPMYEGYKIMIIFLPEYLDKNGNILLKMLEEPPKNTLFILVAEEEEELLPTILSRTQIIRIPRIKDEDINQMLMVKFQLPESELNKITLLADGNYQKATQLAENHGNNPIDDNYFELFQKWIRATYSYKLAEVQHLVDGFAGLGRENQKHFLEYILTILRECLLVNQSISLTPRLQEKENQFVKNFAPFIGLANIEGIVEAIEDMHYHIERNGNPKILFFNLSLRVNRLLALQRKANETLHLN